MPVPLAYCTNVHAGPDLATTRANLTRFALPVRERYSPRAPMGIGLWLSAKAAEELITTQQVTAFRDWLAEHGLLPFTFNGFPYGDFHQDVVKHRVYLPTWWERPRLDYTLALIDVQHALLPAGLEGSISTLPITWGSPAPDAADLRCAAEQLRAVARRLEQLEAATGRLIHLNIEPEPGCVFDRSEHIVRFFEEYLLQSGEERRVRRYLRVCHDVCHAAVMQEPQREALANYAAAGILVGKVQVSSAVRATVPAWEGERPAALAQLALFNEPRYLHQTVVRRADGQLQFFEDLSLALGAAPSLAAEPTVWSVHFHVPIDVATFGALATSQSEIHDCLAATHRMGVTHYEVETYAWGVLPRELQATDLAAGIAREMAWLDGAMHKLEGRGPA